ncbi:Mercuric ion reductase [hydrothermal vent metagenome]|uniref:Mercuric ion reductase n=1 Tax=hydrothermal vent metagenome TaxID=652676 RepID=A0A3B0RBZ5_9ZZZZ
MTVTVEPQDSHNKALVDMLAPANWHNPAPAGRYNMVVIGGGPAGLVVAAGAAGLGARVALVERHLMGGDCLNFGCVPSKALLKAAHKAHDSGQAPDFAAVMEDMRQKRASIAHHDSVDRFSALGIDVFLGDGKFTSPSSIEVAGAKLNFHRAVIATGARAALPPIPGLAEADPLVNESLFSLTELPRRLIVIGAGPIGCEMAQAFRRFGAEVTLIEMADRLVPIEDPEASAILKAQFEKEGIHMILGAAVVRADKKSVTVKEGDQERIIQGDEILVAAGRIPNIEGLDLEAAGVDYHRRGVTVNDRLQTANAKIYAAGDICSPYQFTHSADAMARIVIQNALFFGRKKTSDLVMPWATYTAPEIAHVGMTAKEATEKGDEIVIYSARMAEIDRAVLEGETAGFARIYADRRSGRILGATMMSAHAGESISEMALAITAGLKMADVAATIHPYPTQAEIWKRLAGEYLKAKFTPSIARIFRIFLKIFAKT